METKSRERISVDLQGLKPALLAQSQAQGLSPSVLVRKALVKALGVPTEAGEGVDLRPLGCSGFHNGLPSSGGSKTMRLLDDVVHE